MVRWMRVGAVLAAVVTAWLLVVGDHPTEFVVGDTVLVVALCAAAALPGDGRALPWLVAAFGFSAGVFVVALAQSFARGAGNASVGLATVACLVAVAAGVVALTRRRDPSSPGRA